jgi:uncharacterized OsmC-like protein
MDTLKTRATHLRREQVLLEMDHGTVIADHPVRLGGQGRGPSAGELVAMALSASTALAAAEATGRTGHDEVGMTAMSSYQHGRERIDGPIASLIFMSALRHRLEVAGNGDDDVVDAMVGAARRCRVARAMREGLTITERCEFGVSAMTRRTDPFVNEIFVAGEREHAAKAMGTKSIETPAAFVDATWRFPAQMVDTGVVAVNHGHQAYLVSASGESRIGAAPTPNELLVAALVACTTFYVVHHGLYNKLAIDSITVEAVAQIDHRGVVRSIEKTAMISGDLDAAERSALEKIAELCYVGESMRRGVSVGFEVEFDADAHESLASAECDDGACCIPDFGDTNRPR